MTMNRSGRQVCGSWAAADVDSVISRLPTVGCDRRDLIAVRDTPYCTGHDPALPFRPRLRSSPPTSEVS